MNLSDPSEDESSSDESPVAGKRPRADTYGASSTTSHGSILQESDDDQPDKAQLNTIEISSTNIRKEDKLLYQNDKDPSEDESSSDESAVAAKRPRADTYGASSTTSHGSVLQESDDDQPDKAQLNTILISSTNIRKEDKLLYQNDKDIRLSQSSFSENCSSPNDRYDDFRPGFNEIEIDDNELSIQPSFQDSENSFYNKNQSTSEMEETIGKGYSDTAKRMMSNMGFKPGKGLGKFEHGRVEPVEASTQKGRRGLGLMPSTLGEVSRNFKWSPDDAKPEANEQVTWMPPPPEDTLSGDVLEDWLQTGTKKLSIEEETAFVDSQILKGILEAKTIFDTLYDEDLRHARFRSNPYETIGAVIFLNRAAVKMANIDAVFNFMFTKPKTQNGEYAIDKKEILYFADVCAGPGGFSEYILYRKNWRAKGFGFTLKGPNDFKLSDFYAAPAETFNPYYGIEEDGNIFNPDNLTSLKDHVLKQTEDKGVHFLMADGGFSVEGQENLQEILSKQLYLCQCLAALMLVRTGGHFVVKLFDVFTQFSVGLIYIMYRCFEKVCIHKPVTSRPANSERYLVCFWKKLGTESVEQHLFSVNSLLWKMKDGDQDVTQLVPLNVIEEDKGFYEYIYNSNCVIGERQIKNLLKIAAFSKDKNLKENSQAEMREQCLELWQLPDKVRTQPERMNPDDTLTNILSLIEKSPSISTLTFKSEVLNKQPEYLEQVKDLEAFKSVYDWHFMFLANGKNSPDLRIFIGCGGKQVYQLEGNRWKNVADLQVTLPAKTLIYGEIVKEFRGQGNTQIYSKAIHVIDALMLGGIDISNLPLTERISQCNLFCNALEKPFNTQVLPIRCKRLFNMEQFTSSLNHLESRYMKRVKKAVTIDIPNRMNGKEMFHVIGSILFIKEIKEPWVAQMSKKSGHKYYFRIGADKKPRSEYFIPDEARLDMASAFCSRVMWSWEPIANAIFDNQPHQGVTKAQVEDYIKHNVLR